MQVISLGLLRIAVLPSISVDYTYETDVVVKCY